MDIDTKEYESVEINESVINNIIFSHLVHNCHKETAKAFRDATGVSPSMDVSDSIDARKEIMEFVIQGEAMKAITALNALGADVEEKNADLHFDLLTVHFIELIRRKDCSAALEFAQQSLKPFGKQPKYLEKLQDCMALLAYEEPENSPLFYLLSEDYRRSIAENVNKAVLEHKQCITYAPLERLLQQLVLVGQRLHEESSETVPPFSLSEFLKS